MPSKEVAINDAFRHLYILEPPTCRTKDVTQYRRILRADVIRNKIRMYPNAPHGIYLVDDDGTSATHSQQLFHFFDGPDIEEALAQTRAAASGGDTQTVTGRTTEETLLRQGSSRPQARPTYNPQRRNASVSHASVDSPGVPDQDVQPPMRDTQGIIYVKDENALMPLALSGRGPITTPASCLYTLEMRVSPEAEDVGVAGLKYRLPIDTGASTIWFYQRRFARLTRNSDNAPFIMTTWDEHEHPDSARMAAKKPTIPPEDDTGIDSIAMERYADGGAVSLCRWVPGYEIEALLPSWDWARGEKKLAPLPIPRVLASAANDVVVRQPLDGNLGLAVPGEPSPFDAEHPSTFFEALCNDEHVDEPKRLTIRLIHPEIVFLCNNRAQSYLCYGDYWASAIAAQFIEHGKRVPDFTPRIPVLPTVERKTVNGRSIQVFSKWALPLASITLLVPKHPRTEKSSKIPWRGKDDWVAVTINMCPEKPQDGNEGDSDSNNETAKEREDSDSESVRSIRVILDTGSTHSVLPATVCQEMALQWFGIDSTTYMDTGLQIPSTLDLDDCDLVFTFEGVGGTEVEYQCTASRFLRSPWCSPQTGAWVVPIIAQMPEDTVVAGGQPEFILGLNFFWTAFVRLDSVYHGSRPVKDIAQVYVRLAAQRFEGSDGFRLEEDAFEFHEDLPGRIATKQMEMSELEYD